MKSETRFADREIYALAFGLFLGLCILKFGNPVILDQKILPPTTLSEFWTDAWPTHWAKWFLLPLAVGGGILIISAPKCPLYPKWLLILPLLWFGWQLISATHTVDAGLSAETLWQYFGCVACYFVGAYLFGTARALNFLLAGILAAFGICLICAVRQRIEFPMDYKFLLEGQRTGWTNFTPQMVLDMKHDQTIITTNGTVIANPVLLAKFAKSRVMGTMVYPNALAEIILLLFPASLVLALNGTKKLRPLVRAAAIAVTMALSAAAFFWSGSKFGWLIAMFLGGLCLFRLEWSLKLKVLVLVMAAMLGLGLFALRFHAYFAHGATSVVARFDYWHAAGQTACSYPLFGTGPGTFQRPYARLKAPDAEMARLAHNDYLEQFSDSGFPGGVLYSLWILSAIIFIGRNVWKSRDQMAIALFLGVLGWFIQSLGEFGLFIPASAWIVFMLSGCLLGWKKASVPGAGAHLRTVLG